MVHYTTDNDNNRDRHPLDCFFAPRAVAVIGASERPGSVGRNIFWNLISSPFGGSLYAINPHHPRVLGIRTLPCVKETPEPVDLAMIVTAARTVPAMLDECIDAGVRGVIIISAGFSEQGEFGHALENEVRERARNSGIRVIGPNSLGIMNPVRGLNAAYAKSIARKGNVGFISQSGAVSAAVLDWSLHVNTGFSAFVSFGAMVDVSWSDLVYYLGSDINTKSILIYMESLGDARSFLSAAREVALTKPIIVLKTEQTGVGVQAARTTAYLDASDTADDHVLSAALLRSGVLRVDSVETLFSMAEVLGKQPRPKGPRLTIISNAAGPAVLATDALVTAGGELARLSDTTMAALNQALPSYWNRSNPIDIVPDADPARYVDAIKHAAQDDNTDGLLVLLAPQVRTDPTGTAQAVAGLRDFVRKPILASWMGGDMVAQGVAILNENMVPTFPYPDQAARIFAAMWRYSYALRGLYETPEPWHDEGGSEQRAAATDMITAAIEAGLSTLSREWTRQLLTAWGIHTTGLTVVRSESEAMNAANDFGFPVVLMSNTPRNAATRPEHLPKALVNDAEVRARFQELDCEAGVVVRPYVRESGYELLLGAAVDPQFGPYIHVGAGGRNAELLQDRAYALPPLNTTLARRTLERTHIHAVIKDRQRLSTALRGALEQLLVRFSALILAERRIRDITINPLLLTDHKIIALDARVRLYDAHTDITQVPQPAIRPYPAEYCVGCALPGGESLVLRPIRPEDETLMVTFNKSLSSQTVYFRFLRILSLDQRIRHEQLAQMCCIDYDRQIALVAVHEPDNTDDQRILAIARLIRMPNGADADFAIVVSDQMQGRGLGKRLLGHLLDVAAAEKIRRVVGMIHPENKTMLRLCEQLGFNLSKPVGDEVYAEFLPPAHTSSG